MASRESGTNPGPPPAFAGEKVPLDGPKSEIAAPSFAQNVAMLWRLRSHYAPYLVPALGLLLLALVQADLMLAASTASQRAIDMFTARAAEVQPQPPAHGFTISERLLALLAAGGGPLRIAGLMALFLVAAQMLGVVIEQLRTGVQERFRHALQIKLVAAFATELAGGRTRRVAAENAHIFTIDASQLSGVLIFQTVSVLENAAKFVFYAFALSRIRNGVLIVAIALPVIILLQWVVAQAFDRRQARANELTHVVNTRMRAAAAEFFDVVGRLVYFRGERAYAERLLELSNASANASRRHQLVSGVAEAAMMTVSTLSLPIIIAVLSLPLVAAVAGGSLSAGTIVQAQLLLMFLTSVTASLMGFRTTLSNAAPSVRRVEEVLQIAPPGSEPSELRTLMARANAPEVRVRDVLFRYDPGSDPVLRGVSFDIPAGACVGLVGGSGSGKTTLARALVGDVPLTSGRIEIDGVDVTDWHLWWRRELIGWLPAEQGFVRGTLEDNVLFGRSRDEVVDYERALEVAGVAAIARAKSAEGGMSMEITSRVEDHLSTGERRRVGIARLLVARQRFWIFDEPGSGLDPHTMRQVATALSAGSKVLEGRTTLIITHDPDVFRTDFNLYLENGVVAAQGTHEELLGTSKAYAALVDRYAQERLAQR